MFSGPLFNFYLCVPITRILTGDCSRGLGARTLLWWISGRPVAKYDPLLGQRIQHDPQSRRWATHPSITGTFLHRKCAHLVLITDKQICFKNEYK